MKAETKERIDVAVGIAGWIVFPFLAFMLLKTCGVNIQRGEGPVEPVIKRDA